MTFGPDGEEALFEWRSMAGRIRLAEAGAVHWRGEYERLAAHVAKAGLDVCACTDGPYYGAQHVDSPIRCERCGKVT